MSIVQKDSAMLRTNSYLFLVNHQPGASEGVLLPPVRTEEQTPFWPARRKYGHAHGTHQTRGHDLGRAH